MSQNHSSAKLRLQKLAHICILLVLNHKYPLGLQSEYLFIYIFDLPFIRRDEKVTHQLKELIPNEEALPHLIQEFEKPQQQQFIHSERNEEDLDFKLKTPLEKGISIPQHVVKTRDGNIKFFKHVLGCSSLSAFEIASMMVSYPLEEATQRVASYFNPKNKMKKADHFSECVEKHCENQCDQLNHSEELIISKSDQSHHDVLKKEEEPTMVEIKSSGIGMTLSTESRGEQQHVEPWGNEDDHDSNCYEFFTHQSANTVKSSEQQQQNHLERKKIPNEKRTCLDETSQEKQFQNSSISNMNVKSQEHVQKQIRKRKDLQQVSTINTHNTVERGYNSSSKHHTLSSSGNNRIGNCKVIHQIEDLLDIFPSTIKTKIQEICKNRMDQLVEIVMDKERPFTFYFYGEESEPVCDQDFIASGDDIIELCQKLHFASDDRAGVDGTLHRISRIESRQKHQPIGLTIRVGRAVIGLGNVFKDLLESDKNILCLGHPGSGKTTAIRDIARILSEQRRVMIVDTSCEIAGLGDVPHQAVGRSRRIPVKDKKKQKEYMINAVQNHTPQVIVIDEIGTREEAATARTISQRGVRLVASAHGSLESMLMNPTLCDLLGGVETVTVGDGMAAFRNGQKVIMQTKGNPIFHTVIEFVEKKNEDCSWMAVPNGGRHDQKKQQESRVEWRIYTDVKNTVQNILQGREYTAQVRRLKHDNDPNSVESRVMTFEPANVVFL
ncbi:hypothetical protein C9374_012297 [Naegleria lovaniensis]|uniref:AAA+ ATPase domain-containing protein n=1 Tax=Naegleria lovaniensis TaxID=51637 RepID=A0AA88KCI2_NAELO|nr:uncharacterized protein C9374_012297 [Naegleria lovaniensis]KAG2373308.1 hypothetical protein C9374_012297 [Naegleria lovaniensis]